MKNGAQGSAGSAARNANGATLTMPPDGFADQRRQGHDAKHGAHFAAGQEKQGVQLAPSGADGQVFSVNSEVLAQGGTPERNLWPRKVRPVTLARGADVYKQVESGAFTNLSQGGKQLVIWLDPPELGQVSVVLQVRGKEVQAVLRATSPEATQALNEQLGQLRGQLEAQGLKIGKLEVQTQLPDAQTDAQWQGAEQHNESQKSGISHVGPAFSIFCPVGGRSFWSRMCMVSRTGEKNALGGLDIFA